MWFETIISNHDDKRKSRAYSPDIPFKNEAGRLVQEHEADP
jgi:hypothetical protein